MFTRHCRQPLKTQRRPSRTNRLLRLEHLESRATPAVVNWTGAAHDYNWLTPANWQDQTTGLNHVPGPDDDAVMQNSPPVTVTLAGDDTVHSVTLNPGNLKITAGALRIGPGQSTFQAGLNLAGGLLIPLDGATIYASEFGGGPQPFTIPAGATVTMRNTWVHGGFVNNGTVEATGLRLSNPGNTIVNAGVIDCPAGGGLVLGDFVSPQSFSNSGTVTVAAGATVTMYNSAGQYIQAGGTTTVDGTLSGTAVVQGGVLSGSGTIGRLTQTGGTVSPGSAAGALTVGGNYSQTGGTLAVDLEGTAVGQYDQLKVTGTVSLGGAIAVAAGFPAAVYDTFTIVDNDGTDPVAGTFAGLPEGSALTVNGQPFWISYSGGTGNDLVLTRGAASPAQVAAVQVNDGSDQRSEVRSIAVTFSSPVTFVDGKVAAAFQLVHVQTGNAVLLSAVTTVDSIGRTVVTLGFSGDETDPISTHYSGVASLADGRYQLTILGSAVTGTNGLALDGAGSGTAGSNYISPTDTYQGGGLRLYRLFGDANGDGTVDATDVGMLKQTFNRNKVDPLYLWYLDADNSGAVDAQDVGQLKARFNQNVFGG